MVAAEFQSSPTSWKEDKQIYRFAFAPDGVSNYVCAVDYVSGDIKVYLFIDWLILEAIDANPKMAALYEKVIDQTYKLGGQLCAAGHSVEYK